MISLYYPFNNAVPIVLPNPEIGNVHSLNIKTIIKQNMAGSIYTHIGTTPLYKIPLSFVTLTLAEKDLLYNFYLQAVAKEVRYFDYGSQNWRCILTNDSLVVTTLMDNCSYNCSIELVGRKE